MKTLLLVFLVVVSGGVICEEKAVKPPSPPVEEVVEVRSVEEGEKVSAKKVVPVERKKSKKELEVEAAGKVTARVEGLMKAAVAKRQWEFLSAVERLQVQVMATDIGKGELTEMPMAEFLRLDANTQFLVKTFFPFLIK